MFLFSSAIAKRHSVLGSLGTGGIYITSVEKNETKLFVSLHALDFPTAPTLLPRQLSSEWGNPDRDSLMFAQVGKIGLGGLDISDDSRYLYTINLYDQKLYRIKLDEDLSINTQDASINFYKHKCQEYPAKYEIANNIIDRWKWRKRSYVSI